MTVSETWGSNSAVEAGGVGWRRGVVGASGEHMDEGTHTHKTTTEMSKQVGNDTNTTDSKEKKKQGQKT